MKRTKQLTTYRARVLDTLPHFESLKAKLTAQSIIPLTDSDVLRKAIEIADGAIIVYNLRAAHEDGAR